MAIKETNLIPYEGEIKAGQRLMKVGNSWMPVGVGGMYEPGSVQYVEVGGGVYYQCVSVDTDTTWSGKKWEMVDGIYVLAETVTNNLPYGTGFTPSVGTSYNADATVRVDKMFEGSPAVPEDGLIFYLPFNGNAEPVVGSVTETYGDELTYGEVNGIKYGQFRDSQYYVGTLTESTASSTPFTLSFTFRMIGENGSNAEQGICLLGTGDYWGAYYVNSQIGNPVKFCNQDIINTEDSFPTVWVNATLIYDGTGNVTVYKDGVSIYTTTVTGPSVNTIYIGNKHYKEVRNRLNGDLLDVAVWNRVLTEEEIAQIAARAASMNG